MGGRWHTTQLSSSLDFRGISCATASLCVAVAQEGRLLASTNPTGGAPVWKEIGDPAGPGDLQAVDCLATSFCIAGNGGGNLLTSSEPSGGAASWGEANGGGSVQITGVSCASPSRCAAVDNNGDVLTSVNAAAGSWSIRNLVPYAKPAEEGIPPLNALFGASCPATSLCALVGANGRIFTNGEPFGAPAPAPSKPHNRHRPEHPRTILFRADRFHNVTAHLRFHARFRFYALGGARGFRCKRDRGSWRPCHSPIRYWVSIGSHVLRVRAIGTTGLLGPIAIDHFRVIRNRAH